MINVATRTHERVQADASQSARLIAIAAVLFGCALVFTTGFAGSATLHNAAHDTRHAAAFPCH